MDSTIHDSTSAQSDDVTPGLAPYEAPSDSRLELAVVIPTFNEIGNVRVLLNRLQSALAGIEYEIIFVDDHSPDGTAELLREIASINWHVRVIERIGRRGLASACIEGMLATAAPYLAVMDADMQHDEAILPRMLERIRHEDLDIVIASRNVPGGSMGELARGRVWLSRLGVRVSRFVCHCDVSDAMSGYFVVRRTYFEEVVQRLTGTGFKILVDLLASSRKPMRVAEVPYHFRSRTRGESKLDVNVQLEYLFLILDKYIGHIVPTRFVVFLLVGTLGVAVHLASLTLFYYVAHQTFIISQAMATLIAMTFNFLLNNVVTFRDRRLRGWRLARGLFTFYIACSIGALINVSFAEFLRRAGMVWYVAGLAGTAISSVWNYGVNTILTWRASRA